MEQVCKQLNELDPGIVRWTDIAPCLKKTYAQGRDACQRALRQPAPEHLHDWRKRAKDLWYQLDFLCPEWPPKTKKMLDLLEKLSEQLGDDHDLVLLSQFSDEQGNGRDEKASLRQLIASKRKRYAERVRQLGSALYARMPGPACEQWERDWKTWRKIS